MFSKQQLHMGQMNAFQSLMDITYFFSVGIATTKMTCTFISLRCGGRWSGINNADCIHLNPATSAQYIACKQQSTPAWRIFPRYCHHHNTPPIRLTISQVVNMIIRTPVPIICHFLSHQLHQIDMMTMNCWFH